MTPEQVVRRWFHEVWDEGREEVIDQLMSPDAVAHGLSGSAGAPLVGPQAFKPVFHMFREALGDLEVTVERTVVEGDTCAAYCRVRGRHVGHALGGAPTGKPVEFAGVSIIRVRDGRIVEGWNVFDFLTMYQQIGWAADPVTGC